MIRVECESWKEFLEFCRTVTLDTDLPWAMSANVVQPTENATLQEPAPVAPALVTPAPVAPAPEPVVAPAPAPTPAPAPAKAVTYQDVQTKAIALMDAKKQDQLQALLKKYNVPALPSLPEDQYAAFLADMEAV